MSLKALNSVGGFSVGDSTITTVIYSNTDVTTNNFIASSTANLGDVGNIYIGGGSSLQVLQTDGTGNLNWVATGTQSEIFNGDSNVQIISANGNVYINANAGSNYQWIFETTGNTSFPSVGVVSLGNLVTANYANFVNDVVVQGNIANVNNISVTNNANANNITVTNNITSDTANVTANLTTGNASLGNLVTANYANFTNNIVVQGNIANANNITVTNNITSNTANVIGNLITGNADLGNLATANNFQTSGGAGNISGANVIFSNSFTSNGGTVDFYTNDANVELGNIGNVHIYGGSNGQVLTTNGSGTLTWENTGSPSIINNGDSNVTIPTANSNVYINANGGTNYQWEFDVNGNSLFPANGIANLGNIAIANYANFVNDVIVQGNIANANNITVTNNITSDTANVTGNLTAGNISVGTITGIFANGTSSIDIPALNGNVNTSVNGNANVFIVTGTGANVNGNLDASGNLTVQNANINGNLDATGNLTGLQNANLGNLVTANYANFANEVTVQGNIGVQGNIANANNITVTNNITSDSANVTANLTTGNANLGNLVTANYANFANDVVVQGNIANANNITVTNDITSNTANVIGNLTAGNIIGIFANGTSNIAIPTANGNINLSANGTANVVVVTDTGANVVGTIQSNGNITTNSSFFGNTLTSTGTYLTIASDQVGNSTYNINLVPGGAGNINVNSTYITSLANPVNPQDAATKEYVDSVATGLYIHAAANVLSSTNLNATYTSGGTILSVTQIIGNSTVVFSAPHGLSVDDDISFTNSFNGITGAPDVYWVASIVNATSITLNATYFGPVVNTLTAGSGLTEPALANPGVGATLTNAGAQAALTVDSVLMTVGARVLVIGQTTQSENGIYAVTTVGTGATNWVLTRASDGNTYVPQSSTALGLGSYWFISQGNLYAGSSWVLTEPTTEIAIGTTNIDFTQFNQAGSYTGANGINITGTVISANVDEITTTITSGNIVVKTGAQFTTPNIGAATGTSLDLSANLLSNNVSSNNLVLSNTLTVNTYANVGNLITTGDANIGANLLVTNNISGNTANITGNITTGNANLGNLVTANYANFTNNIVVQGNIANANNITVTNNITSDTANITGNITTGNANLGNLVTANYANISNVIALGNTSINWATANTSSITANLTIVKIPVAGITGIEFFVKGVDSGGSKYSAATVQAVTDSSGNVDFVVYGTTFIGAVTGTLAVNLVDANANIALQVSASSTNTTVWTTQFRTI